MAAFVALIAPVSAEAQQAGELVRFVACPVYRDADAGRKSGCWLADNRETGLRYDVSQSPYKPDWNRAVLVEGRVMADAADVCGGIVLDPARTSVLDAPCPRHLLPAEGFPGRRFVLPQRNNSPVGVARTVAPPPYTAQLFTIYFAFDRDFIPYQYSDYLLDQAAHWLRAAQPKRVVVTGFAATGAEMVSGRMLAERAELAEARAHMTAESLRRLVPGLEIVTRSALEAQPVDDAGADGLPGQSQRRAEIRAEF